MAMNRFEAPWTEEQVGHLAAWQRSPIAPSFTCPEHAALTPSKDGWTCSSEGCGYTQSWAHDFMLDGVLIDQRWETCEICSEYYAKDWVAIKGACASVGIERGMTTQALIRIHMATKHNRHDKESSND